MRLPILISTIGNLGGLGCGIVPVEANTTSIQRKMGRFWLEADVDRPADLAGVVKSIW